MDELLPTHEPGTDFTKLYPVRSPNPGTGIELAAKKLSYRTLLESQPLACPEKLYKALPYVAQLHCSHSTLHQSKLKRKLRNRDVPSCCKRNALKQKGNAKDSKSNVAKKQRVPGKMTPPLQQQLPRQCPFPSPSTLHILAIPPSTPMVTAVQAPVSLEKSSTPAAAGPPRY
jgi:hypothetical protein